MALAKILSSSCFKRSLSPRTLSVSYTHLDVYKRQGVQHAGIHQHIRFLMEEFFEKLPVFFNLFGKFPVSYTHLDVYKRQDEKGRRFHRADGEGNA